MNTRYLYPEDAAQYEGLGDLRAPADPGITEIENGILLPARADSSLPWGLGGVLDGGGRFVEASRLDDAFGGAYDPGGDVATSDAEVLCLGIFPKHWGHFLIDVLCKLWCLDDLPADMPIAYTGLDWAETGGVDGPFARALALAGIPSERLLYVTRPTRFRRLLLPDRTLGFARDWHPAYRSVIRKIVAGAEREAAARGIAPIDKVYFSRMRFGPAQKKEVGEKEIAAFFRMNGYAVVCPEELDAAEQIFLFHHCREYACISGTLAHNAVFAGEGAHLVILNRTQAANPPQLRIDRLAGLQPTYIDAFDRRELGRGTGYRGADNRIVHVLSVNENLERYAKDRGMRLPKRSLAAAAENRLKYRMLTMRQQLSLWKQKLKG